MIFNQDRLRKAREAGYSDDEIWEYASGYDQRMRKARDAGYSLEEVSSFFTPKEEEQAGLLPPVEEMFKPKPKEVGTFEGIANAARNAFASSQQALAVTGGVTPEEAKEISKIEFEKNARQVSPDYKEYQEAQGFDAVKAFARNPFEVTTNIVAEGLAGSLPALGAGLAAGGVGAAVAAPTVVGAPVGFLAGQVAGTFAGSLATEYGSKVLEELQNSGMDINNPDSITDFFSRQELVDAAKDKALKRGVPIAAFDALSAGIGGKVGAITKAAFKTKPREAVAEMAVQAALGGGGEVVGSLAAGDKIDPKAVFAEVVGEVGPGAAEIGVGKIQQIFAERRKQEQIKRAAKVSQDLENNNAPLTADALKTTVAKNAVEEEKATIEETDTALTEEAAKFAPPEDAITKQELKTQYSALSPEDLTDTEATFRERLDDEDPEMRTFAQNALDAIAEVRAEQVTPEPPVTPPVEAGVAPAPVAVEPAVAPAVPAPTEVAPAILAEAAQPEVVEPFAVTPAPLAEPAPPVEAETAASLSRVADNTATDEEVVRLARQGLVNIQEGQNVITPRGEEVMQRGGAPLPRLTPEEGAAEVAATPAIVEQAPPVAEAPAIAPAPVAETPAVAPKPEVAPAPEQEDLVGKKLFDAMGTLPQKANKARQALPGYTPVFKIGDFYDFVGEDAGLSGSTVIGTGKTARSSLPYYQSSNLQEIANRTGKPIAIIEKTAVSEIIQPTPVTTPPVTEAVTPAPAAPAPAAPAPAITPAPVAETPAVTKAPAAEVAPIQRDVTKPEQMTPEEYARSVPPPVAFTPQEYDAQNPKPDYKNRGARRVWEEDKMRYLRRAAQKGMQIPNGWFGDFQGQERQRIIDQFRYVRQGKVWVSRRNRESVMSEWDLSEGQQRHAQQVIDAIGENKPLSAEAVDSYGFATTLPEGYTKQGDLYVYQPTAPAAPTPAAPAAEPAGISVGNRVKYGTLINPYVVEEILPQTESEKREGNQYYRIRSEKPNKNGKYDIADVETKDIKPLQSKSDKRYNPLGYDISDVVEDVKAGKTDTPLRAINQVVEQASEFRNRVKAESERRQQPRKRGKAAILERIARERSAGNITPRTAQALTDFVNRIRDDAIGDTAISIREKGVSNYEFADNLVTFFLSQDKGEFGTAVAIHEFWHGLSRFLPDAEVEQINQDYIRELEAYLKKNPWFLAFVGRYSLTPEQYEAYKKFNPKEAETKLEPQYDERGNIINYKIKFDKENYRYIMLDEFIAEKMTDLIIGKQAVPNTFLGKLAKVIRDFLNLIKARLGKNPYEKFYQLVTDPSQRMRLQRESGVAPPIQIYEPQEYDYSTRRAMMAVEPGAEAAPAEKVKRRTKMQNIASISERVRVAKTKLTEDEIAALKTRIETEARRSDRQTQKEFAKDVTQYLRELTIRGKVSAPQLRAITGKAMQTQFNNNVSIKNFLNYANKVIENANYEKDVSNALATIKRANQLAKGKKGSARIKAILEELAKINPRDIEPSDMSPQQVEIDGEIVTETPISVAQYTAVLKEYMASLGPVTAEEYRVVPEAEILDFMDKLKTQAQKNIDERIRLAFERKLQKALDNKALLPNELEALKMNSPEEYEEHLRKKEEEQRKKIENAITELALDAQSSLVTYEPAEITSDKKEILDFMRAINVAEIPIGDRKAYVMIANNIIVNNDFSGAQKFASIAAGQIGAAEAAKDSKQVKRNSASLNFLRTLLKEKTPSALIKFENLVNMSGQSFADTFRNFAGKENMARFLYQMGFGKVEIGQAKANRERREITDGIQARFQQIEEKTGQKISDKQGIISMGVASHLIQSTPDETEVEALTRMRNLIKQDIDKKKNAPDVEDRKDAAYIEKGLKEVDADTVQGVLDNLKRLHPANYEALIFLKDEVLPEYKPLLKEHDELFNNQTDNYTNANYLPIRYRAFTRALQKKEDIERRDNVGVTAPKQSPNSIKRVKNTVIPKDRQFDYNITKNVLDSLSIGLEAAYTNAGWEQVNAFLESPDAETAFDGAENLQFFKDRLSSVRRARLRKVYKMDGWDRLADVFANFIRTVGGGMVLGGFGQAFKQYPAQFATTIANVNDLSITNQALVDIKAATPLMQMFSIGERGEIAGGSKWANQLEGNFSKLDQYMNEGAIPKIKSAFEKFNDIWLLALKKSDTAAAAHGWISYYRKYLKDNNIPFTSWDNEVALAQNNDKDRVQAGLYADQMIDLYQGSSDPTKMAVFAQRGDSGGGNLLKAMIIPFSSFVIQERSRYMSDIRDLSYGDTQERKDAIKGLIATTAGILLFHTVRRYALPLLTGGLATGVYALLGVDMEEPDEEEKKKQEDKVFRQFLGEIAANILVGGYSSMAENALIDTVNRMAYFHDIYTESDNVLNDDGEVMKFETYRKERAPMYRYTGPGADSALGMVDILPSQLSDNLDKLMDLADEELMDSLSVEEQMVLILAAFSETIYTLRLNDADVDRMFSRMSKEVKEQAEDRARAQRALQRIYGQ